MMLVYVGSWVLIGGCDLSVKKTSTITSLENNVEVEIFRPLSFYTSPVLKVACEPLQPSELPKMIEVRRFIFLFLFILFIVCSSLSAFVVAFTYFYL